MSRSPTKAAAPAGAERTPEPPDLLLPQSEFGGLFGLAREPLQVPDGMYTRLWGSSTHDVAAGVHKPLLATCIVFADTQSQTQLVLLTLDHSWWRSNKEEWDIREFILRQSGIRPEQLMLHVSHTHAAPSTSLALADRPGGHLIGNYVEQMKRTCVRLIAQARESLEPGTLSWAVGCCKLAFNRNFRSPRDGKIIVGLNPAGFADDALLVGRVGTPDGRIRAVLVNYACHPTTLGGANRMLSPDYIGAMRELVEQHTGAQACLFLHGASGDLTPRRSFEQDVALADQNGCELGHAAMAALTSMLPAGEALGYVGDEASGAPLAIWRPRKVPANTAITAMAARAMLETKSMPTRAEIQRSMAECREPYMLERLSRLLLQRENIGDDLLSPFPFIVWQLGDAVLVALAGEPYCAFQIELRRRFPRLKVVVLNIVNGSLGYLPPEEDYAEDTYQAKVALYRPGCATQVLEAVTTTIRSVIAPNEAAQE